MGKDFFQDILPKDDGREARNISIESSSMTDGDAHEEGVSQPVPEKSIRNINITPTRTRFSEKQPDMQVSRQNIDRRPVDSLMPAKNKFRVPLPAWLLVLVAIIVLVLVILISFFFKDTTINITPRSQSVVFDSSKIYTAYPTESAPTGTLSYTVKSFDIDKSLSVDASGTKHVDRKASGTVTLVNEFSTLPVKLVKTTRLQTPNGLVFRAPVDITIPAMKGSTPGTISVNIVADQTGSSYNIPPTSRFSLPGLQGGAMFSKVYARSSVAFTGGYSGEEPSVSSEARSAAIASIKSSIQTEIDKLILDEAESTALHGLEQVTYEELPVTTATSGKALISIRAHIKIPLFSSLLFARSVASAVSSDAESATISLKPIGTMSAVQQPNGKNVNDASVINFTLVGTAKLMWHVDGSAVAQALAGKNDSTFQTIINGFAGIQEARAHIQPFWRHTFPSDVQAIHVVVAELKDSPSGQ